MRRVWVWLARLLAALVVLLLVAAGTAWWYRDRLVNLFIAQANQYIATPVAVGKIDLTFWDTFPHVSLRFSQVTVLGSLNQAATPDTLAQLGDVYVSFNAEKLWRGKYQITRLELHNGHVTLITDKAGRTNFQVLKPDTSAAVATVPASQKAISFRLKKVWLDKVQVTWLDQRTAQPTAVKLYAEEMKASLSRDSLDNLTLDINQRGHLHLLQTNGTQWLADKPLRLATQATYTSGALDSLKRNLSLRNVQLGLADANFAGSVDYALVRQTLKLDLHAREASIQTLLALAPESIRKELAAYRSEGQMYFNLLANGSVAAGKSPHLAVDFGARNLALYHPQLKQRLEGARFTGHFDNGKKNSSVTSSLRLDSIHARLAGRELVAQFTYDNFADPTIDLQLETAQSLATIMQLYAIPGLRSASGEAAVDMHIKGKLNDLKAGRNLHRVESSGDLHLTAVDLVPTTGLPVNNLNGSLLLDGRNLALDNLRLQYGNSDLRLTGVLVNLVPHLLAPDKVLLQAQLEADCHLADLDQIMTMLRQNNERRADAPVTTVANKGGEADPTQPLHQLVARRSLKLSAHVDRLRYQRFAPADVALQLTVDQSQWHLPQLRFRLAGGSLSASVKIDAKRPQALLCEATIQTQGVQADSLFWLCQDFGQTQLTHKNIGGRITTNVQANFTLNQHLKLEPQTLLVIAETRITNGQLRNFQPMQQLASVLRRGDLRDIQFADLQNTLRIDDNVLYIPQMSINSSVLDLSLRGSQNFNGYMDYRLSIPLRNFAREKEDSDARFGTIADDGSGRANVLVLMKGYPDKLTVALDKAATKNSVKESIKREKEELLDLFRKDKKAPAPEPAPAAPPKKKDLRFMDM